MKKSGQYGRMLLNLFLGLIAILLCIFVVPKLIGFFLPFVIGWILAMIANPLVRFLEKKVKIVRKHGSALIIILTLAIVVTLLYFGCSVIIRQTVYLLRDAPGILQSIQEQIIEAGNRFHGILEKLPGSVESSWDSIGQNLENYLTRIMNEIHVPTISDASNMVKNVADALFSSIITILSAYFFIAERDNLTKKIKAITPPSIMEKYNLIVDNFKRAIGGYFKAQFKIMLILIVIMFVGFELLNVSYSFLLALGISLLDFLPFFGTGAVLWPWALVDVLVGNYFRAVALLILYLVCQLVKQVLQPKMVGDSIGIDPLSTLFFMFIGYRLGGFLGIIVGIPLGMVLVNFYKIGMFHGIIEDIKKVIQELNEFRKKKE